MLRLKVKPLLLLLQLFGIILAFPINILEEGALDLASQQFFTGLIEGFGLTVDSNTLSRVSQSTLDLALLNGVFATFGQSFVYPAKLGTAVDEMRGFFSTSLLAINPTDEATKTVFATIISQFKDEATFQQLALKSFEDNGLSPLLYLWDVQDLYSYGLYQTQGSALAETFNLMVFA